MDDRISFIWFAGKYKKDTDADWELRFLIGFFLADLKSEIPVQQ